jgi:hypothetical protein
MVRSVQTSSVLPAQPIVFAVAEETLYLRNTASKSSGHLVVNNPLLRASEIKLYAYTERG